jgi:hypothetical protein
MVESNANYSKLPEEYNTGAHEYPVVSDQPHPHLPQVHNPGTYEYPTVYQQPQPHISQADSQVLSPASKHTGNLIIILMKHDKPKLSLGPGCNHNLDIIPFIWLIVEILVLIWNNSVDINVKYDSARNNLNSTGDCLILISFGYLLALTLYSPGYIRSVETHKIHEAIQNPM